MYVYIYIYIHTYTYIYILLTCKKKLFYRFFTVFFLVRFFAVFVPTVSPGARSWNLTVSLPFYNRFLTVFFSPSSPPPWGKKNYEKTMKKQRKKKLLKNGKTVFFCK